MNHNIHTADGEKTIVKVGCDGCDAENVRISDEDIAYERNRHGTYVRHDCTAGV